MRWKREMPQVPTWTREQIRASHDESVVRWFLDLAEIGKKLRRRGELEKARRVLLDRPLFERHFPPVAGVVSYDEVLANVRATAELVAELVAEPGTNGGTGP